MGRTGGYFLTSMLDASLPSYAHEYYDLKEDIWNKFRYLKKEDLNPIKIISGHGVQFGTHHYIKAHCEYISVLRDPVDRVISQYFAYMTDPQYVMHENFKAQNLTIEEYSERNPNLQTKQLFGWPYYYGSEIDDWTDDQIVEFIDTRYTLLGTTERAFEFLHVLGKYVGIKEYALDCNFRQNNKRKRLDEIPDSVKEEVKSHNRLDYLLYELAERKLNNELAKLSEKEKMACSIHTKRTKLFDNFKKELDLNVFNSKAIERLMFKDNISVAVIDILSKVSLLEDNFVEIINYLNCKESTNIKLIKYDKYEATPRTPLLINEETINLINDLVDQVIILTDPSEDFIVRDSLISKGVTEEKFCFLLNALPTF